MLDNYYYITLFPRYFQNVVIMLVNNVENTYENNIKLRLLDNYYLITL
jgi:hypothetical protein